MTENKALMKNHSTSKFLSHCGLGLALGILSWVPVQAQNAPAAPAKSTMGDKSMEPVQDKPATPYARPTPHSSMMERDQAMSPDLKTQDDEMAKQVAAMNSAPADKKLDLLAAIVTRMSEQNAKMHARMGSMSGDMMKSLTPGAPTTGNTLAPVPATKPVGEESAMIESRN